MKFVNMGDKVELTALQLVYLLDEAMESLILRAEDGQEVDTMEIAKEKVLEFMAKYRKEQECSIARATGQVSAFQGSSCRTASTAHKKNSRAACTLTC